MFQIEGRVWEDGGDKVEDTTTIPSKCVFCGKEVWHINDPEGRGDAWAGSTMLNGKIVQFLYCNADCSGLAVEDYPLWTCVHCATDQIGDYCCYCNKPRSEADRDLPHNEDYQ